MLAFAGVTTLLLASISNASVVERWPGRGKMTIDPNDKTALVAAGNGIARTLMSRYPNDPPGRFENTHGSTTVNWWQTAIAWTGMINHYATTNDYYEYNQVIDSITLNQGEHYDYEPSWAGIQNGEGNDDEAWFVVMTGLAGYDTFGANASGIDWLGNAQKAHYMMSRYWANSTSETDCLCGGGLRWQQDPGDPGWSYLNSITNGQYFLVSALLCERTNDTSYLEWAKDTYSWLKTTGNLTENYQVYDGITAPQCTQGENGSRRFSYLPAALIGGTATMYKVTGDSYWKDENAQFIQGVKDYYTQNDTSVLVEPSCTFSSNCSATNRIGLDRTVFKGILARELARSYTIIPNPTSKEMIQESLVGMVKNCDYDWQCGYFWEGVDDFRNTTMQFQSLELVNAALIVQ